MFFWFGGPSSSSDLLFFSSSSSVNVRLSESLTRLLRLKAPPLMEVLLFRLKAFVVSWTPNSFFLDGEVTSWDSRVGLMRFIGVVEVVVVVVVEEEEEEDIVEEMTVDEEGTVSVTFDGPGSASSRLMTSWTLEDVPLRLPSSTIMTSEVFAGFWEDITMTSSSSDSMQMTEELMVDGGRGVLEVVKRWLLSERRI